MKPLRVRAFSLLSAAALSACEASSSPPADAASDRPAVVPVDVPLPMAACAPRAGGGSRTAMAPVLQRPLVDRGQEGWLASPAVADLDRDGRNEIVLARAGRVSQVTVPLLRSNLRGLGAVVAMLAKLGVK